MVPCSGLPIRQFSFGQDLSEVTARAHFFVVRNQASKRSSILEEHKGRVLVMGAVNAIGEIACRVCDGDGGFFHENQSIRYYIENSKWFQAVALASSIIPGNAESTWHRPFRNMLTRS